MVFSLRGMGNAPPPPPLYMQTAQNSTGNPNPHPKKTRKFLTLGGPSGSDLMPTTPPPPHTQKVQNVEEVWTTFGPKLAPKPQEKKI